MKLRYKILSTLAVLLGLSLAWGSWKISHNAACEPAPALAANAETMRAVRYRCFGGPEVLHIEDVPLPSPGPDEILIRVTAAGVNPLDWHYMRGEPYIMRMMGAGTGTPSSPELGADFAGRVERVGPKVKQYKPGDRVFGGAWGAFGEYLVRVENGPVVHTPDNVSDEQAAGVGVAALTALQALRDIARVAPGQKVLINGASGGVGTFAVQLAKAMGAEVHGVCSTRNVALVQSLGADRVFDYTNESYLDSGERYDAIIDNVGNHSLLANRKVMKDEATLVIVGGQPGNWLGPLLRPIGALFINPFVSQTFSMFIANTNREDLQIIADHIRRGEVTPQVGHRYSLEQVPEAIALSESGRARGKIIIAVH